MKLKLITAPPHLRKFSVKGTFILLLVILLFSNSCKKAANSPSATAINYQALSVKVALSLYNALANQYIAPNQQGPGLPGNEQCGFTTAPVSHFNSTSGDTVKTEVIHFNFISTCSSTVVDGYTVQALDTTITGNAHFNKLKIFGQNYVVQALDQTYKLIAMSGSLSATTNYARFDGPFYDSSIKLVNSDTVLTTQKYVLTGLVIDFTTGVADITSGTATFNDLNKEIDVFSPTGKLYGDQGVIEFIGNHTIKVTFSNGQTFTIHLLDYTGVPG